MAAVISAVVFQASASNTAGNTTTGTPVVYSAAYGGSVNIRITNVATGPTLPGRCEVQVSNDGLDFYKFATVTGNTIAASVTEQSVNIPVGIMQVRTVFTGNTGQSVTVEADGTKVTGV